MISIHPKSSPVFMSMPEQGMPPLVGRVQAGFPSPAEDLGAQPIDLTRELISHPQATFLLRARGNSMVEAGIFNNDILVVDRALPPRHGQIVVAVLEGEFTVKTLIQRGAAVRLQAANPAFPDIVPAPGQSLEIWGVVTASIRQFAA